MTESDEYLVLNLRYKGEYTKVVFRGEPFSEIGEWLLNTCLSLHLARFIKENPDSGLWRVAMRAEMFVEENTKFSTFEAEWAVRVDL